MVAKITILIILIAFFICSFICLTFLLKQKYIKRTVDIMLIIVIFLAASFSGFALFEFIKQF